MRKGKFTDFTLKFCKVVRLRNSFNFLFNLAVNPGPEAPDMNQSTAAFTVARRNQGIAFSLLVAKTNFTVIFTFLDGLIVLFDIFTDLVNPFGHLSKMV